MAADSDHGESREGWLIDSGCTNHMAHDESIFRDLDTSFTTGITVGNGEKVRAKGRGTILVKTKKGTKLITNVFLVLDLKHNLLSVG